MTMEQLSKKKNDTAASEIRVDCELDLDALLHPASAFPHPMDVVRDKVGGSRNRKDSHIERR